MNKTQDLLKIINFINTYDSMIYQFEVFTYCSQENLLKVYFEYYPFIERLAIERNYFLKYEKH